jgi:hypothetical protein
MITRPVEFLPREKYGHVALLTADNDRLALRASRRAARLYCASVADT